MKRFLYKEMLLASFRERKARRIQFDPNVTVVRGENETGKSCLIKSLLRTFGAEPARVHPGWDDADVRSFVRFEIDGTTYGLLRHGKSYAAFGPNEEVLGRFQSVTKELGPFLADLLGFNLKLLSREGELVSPPPAYYFLPYYMDQDVSWAEPWAAFARLGQFPKWKSSVIQYHAGIRGNDYYEAKAVKTEAEKAKNEARRRREGLDQVYQKLATEFPPAQFNTDFSAYRAEMEELLHQCDLLRKDEESFKGRVLELRTIRGALKAQLEITEQARAEAEKDYEFAVNTETEEVECPTCGAHYSNSFAERFSIAVDEDRCGSLALELSERLAEVDAKLAAEVECAEVVCGKLQEIERLLALREGEVTLGDLVRQAGRNELGAVVCESIAEAQKEEGDQAVKMADADARMKQIDSRTRRKEVNGLYEAKTRTFLNQLDVRTVKDKSIRKVDARIDSTGSELPRALLASNMAFLHVIASYGSAAFAPIVIDSPNQQDQDPEHLSKMLAFIKSERPAGSQLILALVDPGNVAYGGHDVVLDRKLSLLSEQEFSQVAPELQHLVNAALKA